jgi:hypothetical protein
MLSLFGFGKKRKSKNKRTNKKPPAKLLRLCKKLKIKVTIKRGSKRVYKKVTLLKKLCKRKMKLKKSRKVRKQRKSRFGAWYNPMTWDMFESNTDKLIKIMKTKRDAARDQMLDDLDRKMSNSAFSKLLNDYKNVFNKGKQYNDPRFMTISTFYSPNYKNKNVNFGRRRQRFGYDFPDWVLDLSYLSIDEKKEAAKAKTQDEIQNWINKDQARRETYMAAQEEDDRTRSERIY